MHERSETSENPQGGWWNTFGLGTLNGGRPLPGMPRQYPNVDAAGQAAALRSLFGPGVPPVPMPGAPPGSLLDGQRVPPVPMPTAPPGFLRAPHQGGPGLGDLGPAPGGPASTTGRWLDMLMRREAGIPSVTEDQMAPPMRGNLPPDAQGNLAELLLRPRGPLPRMPFAPPGVSQAPWWGVGL